MTVQNVFKKGMSSKTRDAMNALSEFIKQKFQTTVDVIDSTGNNDTKVDITNKNRTVLISYKNDFKNWLEMTQNGLARISKPDLRLRDGLMSLNYMIAEESLQAFDEVDIYIYLNIPIHMYVYIDIYLYTRICIYIKAYINVYM
jgi:hypothetical protein